MRSFASLAFATVALALALATVTACGDDGSSGTIDASTVDGPPGAIDAAVDAPGITGGTLGAPCTGTGQGNCAAGYACLNLNGGSGTWCSKPCTSTADMSCATGYTGPGFAACYLSVRPEGGGTPQQYCLVICDDTPGPPEVCPNGPTQCNGTCPTPLMCVANLTSMSGTVVAKACK